MGDLGSPWWRDGINPYEKCEKQRAYAYVSKDTCKLNKLFNQIARSKQHKKPMFQWDCQIDWTAAGNVFAFPREPIVCSNERKERKESVAHDETNWRIRTKYTLCLASLLFECKISVDDFTLLYPEL